MSALRAFTLISRFEFALGGAFFLFAVSALALGAWSEFLSRGGIIAAGVAVWCFSHLIGSQVNCLADRHLDRTYKSYLAVAVERLGRRAVWSSIAIESVMALAIAGWMAMATGRWLLPVLWLAGWVLTLGYSLEPIRLKRRGLASSLCLVLILYVLPVSFGYLALAETWRGVELGVLACVGVQMFCLILLNSAEDVPEDAAAGVVTPCVRYGLARVATACLLLYSMSGICLLLLLSSKIVDGPGRWLFLAVAVPAQSLVVSDMFHMARLAWAAGDDVGTDVVRFEPLRRLGCRSPMHFAVVGLTLCVGSGLALVADRSIP